MMCSTNSRCADLLALGRPDAQACRNRLLLMRRLRPVMMLSITLMPLNSARFWNVRAMPIVATWWLSMWLKVWPLEADVALLRRVDPVDAVQHRAFPCAVRPDDRADLVFTDIERDVRERLDATEGQADVLHVQNDLADVFLPAGLRSLPGWEQLQVLAQRALRRAPSHGHRRFQSCCGSSCSFLHGSKGLCIRNLQCGAHAAGAAVLELDGGLDVLLAACRRTVRPSGAGISRQ
jgi:hypothetical protein